ncbi:MAG: HlyD family efflux transporter periplasmic adaptor subunit, partial [Patescibacteria group bacterium]|nr:HlyD family efflux transporter periplasmic adaptor subunit [Patescibacteria group bacterium]
YEIGEQTKATQPVISMLAEDNYEIEVLISETDIAKIKINDEAKITLDAFGENIKFSGKVFFIEPAETVIQDVIYYKVLVEFANDANPPAGPAAREQRGWRTPSNIKSGMTANVIITTAEKKNVLIMLSRAVIERNGGDKIVRVLVGDAVKEVPVQIGLRGDEGMVEVLGGVKEGDEVVTFMKEKK